MSQDAEVLFEKKGAAGIITLNRPKALNALTHAMCLAMKTQLDDWADDKTVKTIVVQGAGERAFCAGGDIRSLYESGRNKTPYALRFYHDEYLTNATIKHYPKPYVAFIHGIVMGGGVGMSVHGTYRVAEENTVFAMPETGIGLFPDVGGSYFLPRCPGEIGMYLSLTGARLKTADTLYAGVATHFVPAANKAAVIHKLVDGADPHDVLGSFSADAGPAPLEAQRAKIDHLFAGDSIEAILDNLDADGSDWARETAKSILAKSPTSTKVTFRQIREGRRLDFDDCMRMEYRMVNRVMDGHDFFEGVRATIIDKDQSPKWQPADLSGVGEKDVAAYFAPLGEKELRLL